ncbi:MAG: hypothetical protein IJS08_00035, partial [Victivallales bacterium]|nr:hypothetical protein [Victivallales bacterium]
VQVQNDIQAMGNITYMENMENLLSETELIDKWRDSLDIVNGDFVQVQNDIQAMGNITYMENMENLLSETELIDKWRDSAEVHLKVGLFENIEFSVEVPDSL